MLISLSWGKIPAFIPAQPSAPVTIAPLAAGYVSSPFGPRHGRMHRGIDLAVTPGTPIRPFKPGKVVFSGWASGYGQSVLIDHGHGLQSRYAHCSRLLVQAGQRVETDQIIARVGSTGRSTGPHLHFEVIQHGQPKNPAWFIDFHTRQAYPLQRPAKESRWLAGFISRLRTVKPPALSLAGRESYAH